VAAVTLLLAYPLSIAMASNVSLDEIVIGPVYFCEELVGISPFVV